MPKRKKYNPKTDTDKRVGLLDRRQTNQKPKEFPPGRGWHVTTDLRYKRTDPISGKVTYAKESRTGPKDRRRNPKK